MKTAHALLVAASLMVTPSLLAQTDSTRPDGDHSTRPGRGRRHHEGHVLRLRGVADGDQLKLFSLDMRFRRGDAASSTAPRGAGVVHIGEERFQARVVEVEFEPQPAIEVGDGEDPVSDEVIDSDEDRAENDGRPDRARHRRHRRRSQVTRLVVELYAADSVPMPEPMPLETAEGDGSQDGVEPEVAPVDPPPGSAALGKLYLERGTRPLGQREVPVAQGEANVGGAGYAILARAPSGRDVARKVRHRLRRNRRSRQDRSDRQDRRRGDGDRDHREPVNGDVSDDDTGVADAVDDGF